MCVITESDTCTIIYTILLSVIIILCGLFKVSQLTQSRRHIVLFVTSFYRGFPIRTRSFRFFLLSLTIVSPKVFSYNYQTIHCRINTLVHRMDQSDPPTCFSSRVVHNYRE